jgi:diguanylate cyclase (GGDEF)-like protein
VSTALVITAAPDRALVSVLREIGVADVETVSFAEAAAVLADTVVELAVADVTDRAPAVLDPILDALQDAPLVAIVREDQLDAAFDAGAADCIVMPHTPDMPDMPFRHAELVARLRAALRTGTPRARRSRRERRLTGELRKLQRQKQDLERIACVDSLTGVANRRHALRLLEAEWKRSARDGTPLSIVMVDLDCFHAFNERYGHIGGDRCLRRVTDTMVRCLRRPSDYLGRYGGEEFIAVLANTDATGAGIVAERMRAAVAELAIPHEASTCGGVVTMSVGFATGRATLTSALDTLVSAADSALLSAKASGRNRIIGDAPPGHAMRPRSPSTPWRRFPPVVADPWFADRIPPFLENTRAEIERLREATREGTYDRVRALARRLRIAAGEHSIDTIGELAGMLERAARAEDAESAIRVIDELAAYVQHVQVTYRRPLERDLGHTG